MQGRPLTLTLAENDPIRVQRLAACQNCPQSYFNGEIIKRMMGDKARRCRICKCFVHAKTRMNFETCPLNYW